MTGRPEMSAAALAMPRAASLYVYGVIPASDAQGWPGADGIDGPSATVRTLVAGELAALVSALPPDRIPGRLEDLEVHRRVLSLANERGTTIPMRFGIVIDGEDRVCHDLLVRHAHEFTDLLWKLDGHVQMTVRAYYVEDALLREVAETDPEIVRRTDAIQGLSDVESWQERVELGELVAERVAACRARDEQALLDRLAPCATDVRVDPPNSERVALNAHLLVRRDRRSALDDVVGVLGGALQGHLSLRYLGPLPPYSFVNLSLEVGDQ